MVAGARGGGEAAEAMGGLRERGHEGGKCIRAGRP